MEWLRNANTFSKFTVYSGFGYWCIKSVRGAGKWLKTYGGSPNKCQWTRNKAEALIFCSNDKVVDFIKQFEHCVCDTWDWDGKNVT